MVSPTLTRITGPGTLPPNVQTSCTNPGARSSAFAHDQLDVVDLALGAAGAVGSRRTYSGASGFASTSPGVARSWFAWLAAGAWGDGAVVVKLPRRSDPTTTSDMNKDRPPAVRPRYQLKPMT